MFMDWFDAWVNSQNLILLDGVWQTSSQKNSSFVDEYLEVRKKENRIYTDQELKILPKIKSSHLLMKEWSFRERNLKKLIEWLPANNKQTILEIGCGNGWFSANISKNSLNDIVSQDINLPELTQAARVFGYQNPKWICYDIENCNFPANSFDQLIFASSLQYFENPKIIFDLLIPTLKENGCIHIIDSPLYNNLNESQEAHSRTTSYYESFGHPSLAKKYHHHLLKDFIDMGFEIKCKPKNNLISILTGASNPFYWLQLLK